MELEKDPSKNSLVLEEKYILEGRMALWVMLFWCKRDSPSIKSFIILEN